MDFGIDGLCLMGSVLLTAHSGSWVAHALLIVGFDMVLRRLGWCFDVVNNCSAQVVLEVALCIVVSIVRTVCVANIVLLLLCCECRGADVVFRIWVVDMDWLSSSWWTCVVRLALLNDVLRMLFCKCDVATVVPQALCCRELLCKWSFAICFAVLGCCLLFPRCVFARFVWDDCAAHCV